MKWSKRSTFTDRPENRLAGSDASIGFIKRCLWRERWKLWKSRSKLFNGRPIEIKDAFPLTVHICIGWCIMQQRVQHRMCPELIRGFRDSVVPKRLNGSTNRKHPLDVISLILLRCSFHSAIDVEKLYSAHRMIGEKHPVGNFLAFF